MEECHCNRTQRGIGSHHYDLSVPLCLGCAPQDAFDVVRSFSASGAGYAQNGTHEVILTGNNPILQTVNPYALTITNTTLPGIGFTLEPFNYLLCRISGA